MLRRPHRPLAGLPAAALVLALLALVAPAGGAGQPARSRAASAALIGGVSIGVGSASGPAEGARSVTLARALHAKVVRIEVPWAMMEPQAGGELDARALADTDAIVAAAAADGVGVIMLVQGTPCWASSAPASLMRACRPGRASRANAWPPAQPSTLASFLAYLAGRYRGRLTAIEVWNEPDQSNEDYLAGPHKAERYAAMLRAAYPAIKRADAKVSVLAGALVGSNGAFLRALYAAGIKGYYDGLAVHYYNLTLASLRSIHEVQLANGDAKPLWLTEFGWSSCWPRRRIEQEQACVTAPVQAANVASTIRALARVPYVAAAVLYTLRDGASEQFGLVSTGSARKPAFGAFAQALAAPTHGGSVRPTLRLRRRGASVIASGTAAVGDYLQLEAFQHGVLRYRALFTLDRFNRYALTLPSVLGTHGLLVNVHPYPYGAPAPLARASI